MVGAEVKPVLHDTTKFSLSDKDDASVLAVMVQEVVMSWEQLTDICCPAEPTQDNPGNAGASHAAPPHPGTIFRQMLTNASQRLAQAAQATQLMTNDQFRVNGVVHRRTKVTHRVSTKDVAVAVAVCE